jgi:hypothetical protein
MIPYLGKIKTEKIFKAGIALSSATKASLLVLKDYLQTKPRIESISKDKLKIPPKAAKNLENDIIFRLDTYLGEIVIGGFGSSRYPVDMKEVLR